MILTFFNTPRKLFVYFQIPSLLGRTSSPPRLHQDTKGSLAKLSPSLFLCYMVARAPVRTIMLGLCSKCACSPKIVCSLFYIFITFVSDRSFCAKQSARASFWLMCARARSDLAQNLHAVLKSVAFHFLFSWLLSQTAPSMSFLVSQEEEERRKKKMRVKLMASFQPSWLSLGLRLWVWA